MTRIRVSTFVRYVAFKQTCKKRGGCLLYNETYAMDASHIGTGLQVKNKVNPPKPPQTTCDYFVYTPINENDNAWIVFEARIVYLRGVSYRNM
mmetsp:Transcript_21490/g.31743  ORF Transcript_21490/g.31743 Transcript_21490/m.31743 type:complete len:93 (+) Transcript_21490:515-793(+)